MSTPLLPSFRRQQLVLDFSSLRDECPEGIYLSLTPGNPSLWGGVFFVRNGPYAEAILRFQISFSNTYPTTPPLVTFSTDIFHPLVVPLTTYTFSAHVDTSSTVSASDEDRLPPGAFSLRYGFPPWFIRGRNTSATSSLTGKEQEQGQKDLRAQASSLPASPSIPTPSTDNPSMISGAPLPHDQEQQHPALVGRKTILLNLLQHIYSSFTDASLLDSIPLSAAGNPSAWHAWRAHQGLTHPSAGKTSSTGAAGTGSATSSTASPSSPKHPGDWKWDGVWESRVESAVRESIAEGTLFGTSNVSTGLGLGEMPSARLGFRGGSASDAGRGVLNSSGASNLDARQKLQALADKQIRFTKMADEGLNDVKRRTGVVLGTNDGSEVGR